ncbi:MAG: hypothetical protein CMJ68_13110 [Planctomycetaceae bacterium]|nr:hypothetical protein [Planctomycetaceae bacterium]|tara:strand:+ start:223 stop:819 length:597 start_codon:yes stop_codon:yes gene_type:complete
MGQTAGVAGFLRYLTLLNAGVWLGAAVFMFVVALTIFTAPEMNAVVAAGEGEYQNYLKGLAGQLFFQRFYLLQFVCAGVASLLLFLEWKLGKQEFPKWRFGLLVLLSVLVLAGGLWLRPKLENLFQQKYAAHSAVGVTMDAGKAAAEHDKWHRVSEGGYGGAVLLLLAYFAVNCRQPGKPRAVRKPKAKMEFRLWPFR